MPGEIGGVGDGTPCDAQLPADIVGHGLHDRVHEVRRLGLVVVDFATSNVRGAPFDLFIAGAKILANYPMGPTGGTAFNVTVLSSGGSLDIGVNIDTAAVDDPELLRRCLEDAYAELLSAG